MQEAPPPPAGLARSVVFEPFPGSRGWGTAIWSRTPLERLEPTTSRSTPASRPGATAAAELATADGLATLISVHGVDDRIVRHVGDKASEDGDAVATMHRLLSDMTGYLDDGRRRGTSPRYRANVLVLGGDLELQPGLG